MHTNASMDSNFVGSGRQGQQAQNPQTAHIHGYWNDSSGGGSGRYGSQNYHNEYGNTNTNMGVNANGPRYHNRGYNNSGDIHTNICIPPMFTNNKQRYRKYNSMYNNRGFDRESEDRGYS
uniref:Uncharacterized protein n=1 Tax=Lygus hesperus TaxID=30085 RepID=A0A0A9VVP7_LYGHE